MVHEHVELPVERAHDLVGVELVDRLAGARGARGAHRHAPRHRLGREVERDGLVAARVRDPQGPVDLGDLVAVDDAFDRELGDLAVVEVEPEEVVARRAVDDAGVGPDDEGAHPELAAIERPHRLDAVGGEHLYRVDLVALEAAVGGLRRQRTHDDECLTRVDRELRPAHVTPSAVIRRWISVSCGPDRDARATRSRSNPLIVSSMRDRATGNAQKS